MYFGKDVKMRSPSDFLSKKLKADESNCYAWLTWPGSRVSRLENTQDYNIIHYSSYKSIYFRRTNKRENPKTAIIV